MPTEIVAKLTTRTMQLSSVDELEIPAPLSLAMARREILFRWKLAIAKAGERNRDACTRRFLGRLKSEGKLLSRPTLYLWDKRFKRRGVEGLIDGRTHTRTKTETDAECRALLHLYVDQLSGPGLIEVAIHAARLACGQQSASTGGTN